MIEPFETFLLGITGTIAAGKSTATECFRRLGVPCFDADRAGHDCLRLPDVKQAIFDAFGPAVFVDMEKMVPADKNLTDFMPVDWENTKVEIDRKRLAAAVFAESGEKNLRRRILESITHPAIEGMFDAFFREVQQKRQPLAVLDAALLFESGWNRKCRAVLCVDADEEIRRKRALLRGWPEGELERREKNQWSLAQKREQSDFVLNANGEKEALFEQIQHLLEHLR